MKKIICSLVVLSSILLSCGSDDTEDTPQDPIVGRWQYSAQRYIDTEIYEGNPNGDNEFTIELDACEAQTLFTFNADNSGELTSVRTDENSANCISNTSALTWTKNESSSDMYTLNFEVNNVSRTYTVSFEANTVTLEWFSEQDNHRNFDTYTKQ